MRKNKSDSYFKKVIEGPRTLNSEEGSDLISATFGSASCFFSGTFTIHIWTKAYLLLLKWIQYDKGLFINDVIFFRGGLDPPSSCKITFWLTPPPPLVMKNHFLPNRPLSWEITFYLNPPPHNITKKINCYPIPLSDLLEDQLNSEILGSE